MLLIVEKDNGRTVDIRLGELVRVNLPENATTGYRWAIDRYDEEFIEAVATEPHYTANAIGSGGEVEFIFKGKKIGSGGIMLKHWRHWEGDSSITSRFRLRLNVQP
jgi:inhibitor of cysteine peptidase